MKKIKILLLSTLTLFTLLFSGCELISGLRHIHDFQYMSIDNFTHYKECRCGEKTEPQAHSYKWIVDEEATESKTGLTHKECVMCHLTTCKNTVTSVLDGERVFIDWFEDGDPAPSTPIFTYEISVEFNKYVYEKEFDVKISLNPQYNNVIKDGEFCIKIAESPYYEIVGEKVYSNPDFKVLDAEKSPLEFTFRIKATYPCNLLESIKFHIKCNYNLMEAKKVAQGSGQFVNYDFDEEYFYTINALTFINDSEGVMLGEWDAKLFYDSINRDCLNGTITNDQYIDRVVEFNTDDRVFINKYLDDIIYASKNIRARFTLGNQGERFLNYIQNGEYVKAAEELLGILLENDYITSEEYTDEIKYISDHGFAEKTKTAYSEYMLFADYYKDNYYDYHYTED